MFHRYPLFLAALMMTASSQAKTPEIELFNGKDLSNWTAYIPMRGVNANGHLRTSDLYYVRDGYLNLSGTGPGNIRTLAHYTNYRLTLEWRWVNQDVNIDQRSGLFLRMSGGEDDQESKYQIEIANSKIGPKTGDIFIMGKYSSAFTASPPADPGIRQQPDSQLGPYAGKFHVRMRNAERPRGEWNRYVVIFDKGHLVVHLNGQLVGNAQAAEVVAGAIGLQSEGAPIQFRNIRLSPLDD